MEAVYPAAASALARGRRARREAAGGARARHRTMPVTFAEIKEVDEENEEEAPCGGACGAERERRRPDVLGDALGRQFAEFRRRRPRRAALPEPPDEPPAPAPAPAPAAAPAPALATRAGSEPLQPR